ncbi:MAG: hypothetical protein ACRDY2_08580 [Acidimicrobiales bacterium]
MAAPTDEISPQLVYDQDLGVSYPARAAIWVDGIYCFTATSPADWRAALARAGMAGGTVLVPADGPPGDAWCEADLRMARLVRCSCGDANLDPDTDAFAVLLCERCHTEAGWESAHLDNDHDRSPDPACPICADTDDQPPTSTSPQVDTSS